jgi:dynein light chain 1
LDFLGKSLKELWISYNEIEKLDGLKSLIKLEKLYIGNNLISKIDELNNLANLPELKDVVFKGNPFTLENPSLWNSKPQDRNPQELYPEIQKRLPNIQIIDGNTV